MRPEHEHVRITVTGILSYDLSSAAYFDTHGILLHDSESIHAQFNIRPWLAQSESRIITFKSAYKKDTKNNQRYVINRRTTLHRPVRLQRKQE